MSHTLDIDTLTAAAAQKAHDGDAAGAAGLLRQVLDLQAAALGPNHRDLAQTLNNLALMLERQGTLDEAEACYRRAYEVARTGSVPNDPLVLVSRSNLVDFLRATGRPVALDEPTPPEQPAQPPAIAPVTTVPPVDAAPPGAPRRATTRVPPPAPARPPAPPPVVRSTQKAGAPAQSVNWPLIALAVLAALAFTVWFASRSDSDAPATAAAPPAPVVPPAAEPPAASEPPPPPPASSAVADAAPAPPPTSSPPPTRESAPPAKVESAPPAKAARGSETTAPPAAAPARSAPRPQSPAEFGRPRDTITADGDVCAGLTRSGNPWRCSPLGDGDSLDAVYYYTRVRSPRDIVVRHRWSYAGKVIRTVDLRVSANTAPGFRTFSRQATGGRRGPWEVALLGPDGAVVDAQRFTVP